MTVLIHPAPTSILALAEIEAWRAVPVAVAVDLMGGVGHIDPAIRPLNPPGRQPRLFGRAVTVRCEPPISARSCRCWTSPVRATW